MNYLQYTSKEMFSATELIRQSKKVFDRVKNKEIDKAIILRDGKPSFILFDFEEYEKIMNEFILLKESMKNLKKPEKNSQEPVIKENTEKTVNKTEEINEDELQKALDDINNLPSNDEIDSASQEKITAEDESLESSKLKDFWE